MQEEKTMFGEWFYRYLLAFVGEDAANALENCEEFVKAVEENVKETSAFHDTGEFNDDDVRLAVGRVIMAAFHACT